MRRTPLRRARPALEDLEERNLLSFTTSLDTFRNILLIETDRDNNELRITETAGVVFVDDLKDGGGPAAFDRADVDVIVFRAGPGNDKFFNDTAIPADVDGGNGNNHLQGGAAQDTIVAGPGNDTLIGLGDFDQLNGGGGNDRVFQDGLGFSGGSDGGTDGGSDGFSDGGSDGFSDGGSDGFSDGWPPLSFTPFLDVARDVLTLVAGPDNVHVRVTEVRGLVLVDDFRDSVGPLSFARADVGFIAFQGGPGNDWFVNDTGIPSFIDGGDGNNYLQGGNGPDTIVAGPGNDTLNGLGGDDLLDGGAGNDNLNGGFGNDVLRGGPGNDFLDGGPDRDQLFGGLDRDSFRGPDRDRDREPPRGRGRRRGRR